MNSIKFYYCAVLALLATVSTISIYALAENYEGTIAGRELQAAIDNYAKDNCLTSERLACDFKIAYDGKIIGSGVTRGYKPDKAGVSE